MDLAEARGRMPGATDDAGYVERFGKLSLLDHGILERPCAPLLLCNGNPKSVRFFPGGHMGHGPNTLPTMVAWMKSNSRTAAHEK